MEPETIKIRWSKSGLDKLTTDRRATVARYRTTTFGTDSIESGLRSISWKIFLNVLPNLTPSTWSHHLKTSRARYHELRQRLIELPKAAIARGQQKSDYAKINPLAPDSDNPWTHFFKDNELRKVILQDVERTFPDLELFREESMHTLMSDILFIYCKLNAITSYRQGMHELLAPLVFVLRTDSRIPDPAVPTGSFFTSPDGLALWDALNPDYIEHDAFAMFEHLMVGAGPWFETPSPDEASRLARAHKARNQTSLIRSLNYPPKSSTPILALCYRVYYTRLATCDPPLFAHLERLEIEPQLFGLRWFRLLFTREYPFPTALKLWDGILAYSGDLALAEFVALAMLIYLRDQIVDQDYSTTLQRLMRFPALNSINVLLKQASQLAREPETIVGYQVATENYQLKGIHLSLLPPFPTEEDPKRPGGRSRTNSTGQMNTQSGIYSSRKHAASTSNLTTAPEKPPRVPPAPSQASTDKKSHASVDKTSDPITKKVPTRGSDGPRISRSQIADLDTSLKSGLEFCLQLMDSEDFTDRSGESYPIVVEGLHTIIATLQSRIEVLKGKPFDGAWQFNFPASKLATLIDKEHWEFVSKPESDLDTVGTVAPVGTHPSVSVDHPIGEGGARTVSTSDTGNRPSSGKSKGKGKVSPVPSVRAHEPDVTNKSNPDEESGAGSAPDTSKLKGVEGNQLVKDTTPAPDSDPSTSDPTDQPHLKGEANSVSATDTSKPGSSHPPKLRAPPTSLPLPPVLSPAEVPLPPETPTEVTPPVKVSPRPDPPRRSNSTQSATPSESTPTPGVKKGTPHAANTKLKEVRQQYDWIFGTPDQPTKGGPKSTPALTRGPILSTHSHPRDPTTDPLGILTKRQSSLKASIESEDATLATPSPRGPTTTPFLPPPSDTDSISSFSRSLELDVTSLHSKADSDRTHDDTASWSTFPTSTLPPTDLPTPFSDPDPIPSSPPSTSPTPFSPHPRPHPPTPAEFYDNPW